MITFSTRLIKTEHSCILAEDGEYKGVTFMEILKICVKQAILSMDQNHLPMWYQYVSLASSGTAILSKEILLGIWAAKNDSASRSEPRRMTGTELNIRNDFRDRG